jgi:hypothetical protein
MRRPALRSLVIAVALLGSSAGLQTSASAEGQTTCTFANDVDLSPGFSLQPGSGTFTEKGAPIECTGPVNGEQPTGIGTEDQDGRYGVQHPNSCASAITGDGEGDGVFNITIPTTGGDQRLTTHFTFTFGRKVPTHGGLAAGEFKGDHFSGTFEFKPIEGDCVTKPVTKVHVMAKGVLH